MPGFNFVGSINITVIQGLFLLNFCWKLFMACSISALLQFSRSWLYLALQLCRYSKGAPIFPLSVSVLHTLQLLRSDIISYYPLFLGAMGNNCFCIHFSRPLEEWLEGLKRLPIWSWPLNQYGIRNHQLYSTSSLLVFVTNSHLYQLYFIPNLAVEHLFPNTSSVILKKPVLMDK